jgi:hypothetical protein
MGILFNLLVVFSEEFGRYRRGSSVAVEKPVSPGLWLYLVLASSIGFGGRAHDGERRAVESVRHAPQSHRVHCTL